MTFLLRFQKHKTLDSCQLWSGANHWWHRVCLPGDSPSTGHQFSVCMKAACEAAPGSLRPKLRGSIPTSFKLCQTMCHSSGSVVIETCDICKKWWTYQTEVEPSEIAYSQVELIWSRFPQNFRLPHSFSKAPFVPWCWVSVCMAPTWWMPMSSSMRPSELYRCRRSWAFRCCTVCRVALEAKRFED